MTNDKHSAEQEAEKVAGEYAYLHMRVGHIENDLRDAHLAGQSVGYQRALEEVNDKILEVKFWRGVDNPTLIKLGEILTNLKAKGGV